MKSSYIIPYKENGCEYRRNNFFTVLKHVSSFDGTEIIIVEQGEKQTLFLDKIKYVFLNYNGSFNRSWAMNVGAKVSESSFITFADADLLIDYSDYKIALELLKTHDVVDPKGTVLDLSKDGSTGLGKRSTNFCGGITLFNKAKFFEVRGFDEAFIGWGGEDDALTEKIKKFGFKIMKMNSNIHHLFHPSTNSKHSNYTTNLQVLKSIKRFTKDELIVNHLNKISDIGDMTKFNIRNDRTKFKITRLGKPIGDILLASLFVHVLNDNGIEAVFDGTTSIINCPKPNENENYVKYEFVYKNEVDKSILESAMIFFTEKFGITKKININRSFIPINFVRQPCDSFDVVLVTKSGFWSEIRNWPFFDELKEMLSKNNITWKDITSEKDNNFLNFIDKAKVFITLETGSSHLASQLITKKKTLLIQSGYSKNSFWNSYAYDTVIANDISCSPCFLRTLQHCKNGHNCMKKISVNEIFKKIQNKLEEK